MAVSLKYTISHLLVSCSPELVVFTTPLELSICMSASNVPAVCGLRTSKITAFPDLLPPRLKALPRKQDTYPVPIVAPDGASTRPTTPADISPIVAPLTDSRYPRKPALNDAVQVSVPAAYFRCPRNPLM